MASSDLLTPRLRLRLPREGDAEILAELSTDLAVARMVTRIPYPNTAQGVREALVAQALSGEFARVIDDGAVQGMCGLGPRGIGYWLAARARGKGYASEAAQALLAHAFGPLRRRRVEAGVFQDNPASLRVLTRLGFRTTGAHRAFSLGRGEEADGWDLEIDRETWAATLAFRIVTPRLVISPLTAADAPALAAMTDPQTARMTSSVFHPMTPEQAAERIAARSFRGRPGFCVGVRLDGRLVGELGLAPLPCDGSAPDVGMWFAPGARGKGLATEAMAHFLPAAMDRFGLGAVRAEVFEDNPASQRVLGRLGFATVGHDMGDAPGRPDPALLRRMSLTREALQAALDACPERNAA